MKNLMAGDTGVGRVTDLVEQHKRRELLRRGTNVDLVFICQL